MPCMIPMKAFRDMYNKVYSNLKSYSICPVTRPTADKGQK